MIFKFSKGKNAVLAQYHLYVYATIGNQTMVVVKRVFLTLLFLTIYSNNSVDIFNQGTSKEATFP